MKDRIKQFIDYKGISPGDLASALDVQRSNISHILNGRNKPGAAFIEKLLLVYPDVDARWLLTGIGNMISTDNNYATVVADTPKHEGESGIKSKRDDNELKRNNSDKTGNGYKKGYVSDSVDKLVLLYSDGTFITYNSK